MFFVLSNFSALEQVWSAYLETSRAWSSLSLDTFV